MRAHHANANLPPALGRRRAQTARAENAKSPADRASGGPAALLLACGNSLRADDGVGLRIAAAVEECIPASRLRVVAAQQFTPEMAADLAAAELVIFVDASAADEPGAIRVVPVCACVERPETHRLDPAALLALAQTLCGHAPARAFALTVGAANFGYGEDLTGPLLQAVPRAARLVTNLVSAFTRQV
ncbi:MAG TPA: hydrogenase maturation protease [Acidobacteriaceae bacterium]|jgi:hydrogenase maturation protease|nr:hydrogenase maturation protease [Acidobacteriaceae bacterium]